MKKKVVNLTTQNNIKEEITKKKKKKNPTTMHGKLCCKLNQNTNDKLGENIYYIYIKQKTNRPIKRSYKSITIQKENKQSVMNC